MIKGLNKFALITLVVVSMALSFFCLPVSAVDYSDCMVYDLDDSLTNSQEEYVNKEIVSVAEKLDMNVAIVITDDILNKTAMSYADDFYDDVFGINTDGVLLLINNDTNYDWISTSGKGISKYSDSDIDKMFDKITPKLQDKNFEGACTAFINSLTYNWFAGFAAGIMIGVVISVIAGIFIASRYKMHKSLSPTNYICQKDTRINVNTDSFIREYVTKQYSPRESSSGGSSTHTSSGGGTHGGGGRGR